ncbi:hypothetical protein LFT63_11810 [Staphylococcus sp. FSL H8-0121]|uniref:hypothetical protein n=1 Tax=Staphylococcus sp. FSL H8-0121 TaxID=2921377 RepID=UPI0030F74B28
MLAEEGKFERSNSEIKAIVNGREVRWEEIKHWKSICAAHVLQELIDLGQDVYLNQQVLTHQNFYQLTEDELIQAAIESKLALGTDKILEIYDERLNESDAIWKTFVQCTPKYSSFKERHVIIGVEGINPTTVSNIDQESGMSLEGSYSLHPELSQKDNMQLVMETFGNYKHPSLFKFEMLEPNIHKLPGDIDPNAAKVIFGVEYLAHTGLNINQYAMHQFFPKDNGLKIDLGIFVPQGIPDEAVIGHMEHFAIEFSSVFKNLIDMMRRQSEK